jgi:hypothetical protein
METLEQNRAIPLTRQQPMSPYEKLNTMTSRKKNQLIYWSLVYGLNEAKSSKNTIWVKLYIMFQASDWMFDKNLLLIVGIIAIHLH